MTTHKPPDSIRRSAALVSERASGDWLGEAATGVRAALVIPGLPANRTNRPDKPKNRR
jgi:hypothetical protein